MIDWLKMLREGGIDLFMKPSLAALEGWRRTAWRAFVMGSVGVTGLCSFRTVFFRLFWAWLRLAVPYFLCGGGPLDEVHPLVPAALFAAPGVSTRSA